jgi:predicted Na+-dependent transporter
MACLWRLGGEDWISANDRFIEERSLVVIVVLVFANAIKSFFWSKLEHGVCATVKQISTFISRMFNKVDSNWKWR